jgi:hypothetical protein
MPTDQAADAAEALRTAQLMRLAGLNTWRLDSRGVVASANLCALMGLP